MREIKYQAWYNGKMYAVNMIIWYSETNIVYGLTDPKLPGSQIHVGSNEAQRREYTGIKDDKGKEIYEGDIVSHEYENVTGWHKRKLVVAWNNNAAAFEVPTHGIWTRNIKVIGNIYENPELLEATA